jgi:hypothetical protein
MPTALLLRFSLCSLLLFATIFDTSAQRRASRRSVTPIKKEAEEKSSDQLELLGWGRMDATIGVQIPDSIWAKVKKFKVAEWEPLTTETTPVAYIDSTTEENAKTVDCRETNGINKSKVADSYPYLSEDGLRLYFTSNREGGHGRFFISTRKSINDPFAEPKVLSKNLTDGYYAGTLTGDELTLCMVNSGSMYISTRSNRNEEFPSPIIVTGTTDSYNFGPSISKDGKEIIVTVKSGGKDKIRVYRRTGPATVDLKSSFSFTEGSDPGPGQFSKDGLSYYFSVEKNDKESLWRFTRKTITDDIFGNPEQLPEHIKGLKNYLQPSLNGDGSILVFVTSPNNVWEGDDIILVNIFKKDFASPRLADSVISNTGNSVKMINKISTPQLIEYSNSLKEYLNPSKQLTIKTKDPANGNGIYQLKVYPNPFAASINVEISELPGHGALFNLYDLSGKIIKQQKINDLQTRVVVNQLLAGVYTYQVVDEKGKLISSGKLVKGQ